MVQSQRGALYRRIGSGASPPPRLAHSTFRSRHRDYGCEVPEVEIRERNEPDRGLPRGGTQLRLDVLHLPANSRVDDRIKHRRPPLDLGESVCVLPTPRRPGFDSTEWP